VSLADCLALGKPASRAIWPQEREAVYLRIDTIEQAIHNSPGMSQAINKEGYRVA